MVALPTVLPRIVVADAEGLVAFMKDVFGAAGEYIAARPAEMRIGDSVILVSDAGVRETYTAFLYVYVADADATYRLAVDAGARTIEEPLDTPYGDRRAMVVDRWGNTWQMATRSVTSRQLPLGSRIAARFAKIGLRDGEEIPELRGHPAVPLKLKR